MPDLVWPRGCPKPGSCERHRACVYWPCPHTGKGDALATEIDAAIARAIAERVARVQEVGQ